MSSQSNTPNPQSDTPSNDNAAYVYGTGATLDFILSHKLDTVMYVARLICLGFSVLYFFPFVSNHYEYYNKALLANAVISMMRLYQRLPRFQFSRQFLSTFLQEDSCHYLLYSLTFLFGYPTSLVLFPLILFSALHAANFTLKLFHVMGPRWNPLAARLSNLVHKHAQSLLRVIAFDEIFLMPLTVCMIFISGKLNLVTPIVHYRFLLMRYQSKRNPYTRAVFYEMRVVMEFIAMNQSVPNFIRQLCQKMIEVVSRLAPPVPTAS